MNLRLYTFVNCYLSSIQAGVQTAHVVHELLVRYRTGAGRAKKMVYDWAQDHKTIIVLNGGGSGELYRAATTLNYQTSYPWALFREDAASLDGALTAVGVVLPESIYGCTTVPAGARGPNITTFITPAGEEIKPANLDWNVLCMIKSADLAR